MTTLTTFPIIDSFTSLTTLTAITICTDLTTCTILNTLTTLPFLQFLLAHHPCLPYYYYIYNLYNPCIRLYCSIPKKNFYDSIDTTWPLCFFFPAPPPSPLPPRESFENERHGGDHRFLRLRNRMRLLWQFRWQFRTDLGTILPGLWNEFGSILVTIPSSRIDFGSVLDCFYSTNRAELRRGSYLSCIEFPL